MSTPGSAVPEEKKGISKYVSRMRSVLKRSDGSKRLSFSSKPSVVATASTTAGQSAPANTPVETKPGPVEAPVQATTTTDGPQPTKVLRAQIDEERARKLSERFKVPIDTKEWIVDRAEKEAYRIEKPVRMRIHRSCHECNTAFGGNKVCVTCQHSRCADCPRYPPKKDKSKAKEKKKETVVALSGIEADHYWNLREEIVLTRPSKTGGQPLVRKKPMQRVRRTCHECQSLFPAGNKICGLCSHVRCVDCPRDPAKKKRYPDGYPGDQQAANSPIIKYDCHQCLKPFPAVPNPNTSEGASIPPLDCTRCGHTRCSDCKRAPPRKIDPAPDPEVVRSLEAKLQALRLERVDA